jgi:SAM-dependent methyltransferase
MTDSTSADTLALRAGYDDVEEIGELYDHVPTYRARHDIGFYVDEARAASGEALEIGCGTGRVLIPAARRGIRITGVDRSLRMLERCREQISREPPEVRERVTIVNGDVRNMDLGKRFSIITLPFRPIQHLLTVEDQLAALASIHRHLIPSGRLVFDVFNPNIRSLVDETRAEEHDDTPETPLPDGRSFRRTARIAKVHITEQYSEVELIYYVRNAGNAGGATRRLVQSFRMRWFWRFELEHLLARSGFRVVSVYGDFDRTPLTDASNEMIFIAERI